MKGTNLKEFGQLTRLAMVALTEDFHRVPICDEHCGHTGLFAKLYVVRAALKRLEEKGSVENQHGENTKHVGHKRCIMGKAAGLERPWLMRNQPWDTISLLIWKKA
jgi:hypothetical protein